MSDITADMRFELQRTFEFKNRQGEKVKEEAGVDMNNDYVQYHSVINGAEVWVSQNFKRVSIIADLFHTDLRKMCGSMDEWLCQPDLRSTSRGFKSRPPRCRVQHWTSCFVTSSKLWYRPMGVDARWLEA